MRLCICTLWTHQMREVAEITIPVNRRYAARHGHDFVAACGELAPRPPSWSKIVLVNNLLMLYDWVMWLDADALITAKDEDLMAFLPAPMPENCTLPPQFIIGKQFNGINAGVFFLNNCPKSATFLADIWKQKQFTHHGWWEQAAMNHLLEEDPERIRAKYVDKPRWNRLPPDFMPGDVLHPAGMPMMERAALLRKHAEGL